MPIPKFWLLPLSLLGYAMVGLIPSSAMAQAPADGRSDGAESRAITNADRLRELVRTGITAYRKGDQESARIALVEAIKLNPGPTVIATLADIEMRLGRFRDAAEHWTIFLNVAPPGESKERTEAEAQLKSCLDYVGSVMVTVQPETAVLWVDGSPVVLGPTKGRLWLNSGLHTMQVKTSERSSEPQERLIRKGENTPLTFEVPGQDVPVPAQPVAASSQVNLESAPTQRTGGVQPRTIALIGGGVLTLIAASMGTVYWVKNGNAKDDADALTRSLNDGADNSAAVDAYAVCKSTNAPSACDALKGKNDDMKRTANISDYSFVAAGVLGVATLGAYFLWPRASTSTNSTARSSLVVAPWWTPTNQGVAASLAF